MNIQLISDCHLNWGPLVLPGGDVLVMAGDIFEASDYRKGIRPATSYYDQFTKELDKYQKVLYVFGNHEHYGGDYSKTASTLGSHLPSHVTFLENSWVEIEGTRFWGATLWTDMGRGSPLVIQAARGGMNDFNCIKYKRKVTHPTGHSYWTSEFSPQCTTEIHRESLLALQRSLQDPVPHFVITHHAPTHRSIDPRYSDSNLNYCYYSDLSNTILDNPHIQTWVHGHLHNSSDYYIGTTRVVCNPRGYYKHEHQATNYQPIQL